MKIRTMCSALVLALAAWGLAAGAAAETVMAGDTLAPLTLEDQHGEPGAIDASTRGVLLSRDMDGGAFVREALAEGGAASLERAGAVYVADVSGMPRPIRRFIAIPGMRDRGYRVLLDTEGTATASLPSEKGKATWLRLEGLRIVELRVLSDTTHSLLSPSGTLIPKDLVKPCMTGSPNLFP